MLIFTKDTDQKTGLILQDLPLKTVILIISRQIKKNTKPKGTIVKAKFRKNNLTPNNNPKNQPEKDIQSQ